MQPGAALVIRNLSGGKLDRPLAADTVKQKRLFHKRGAVGVVAKDAFEDVCILGCAVRVGVVGCVAP